MLVLAQEQWDEVERRNQLLVRAFADRNPRSRFLFCEQPFRAGEFRKWQRPRLEQVLPGVWTFRPVRPLPDSRARGLADRAEAAQIRWASKQVGLIDPVVWTQDPRAASLLQHLPGGDLVYDLTDDWAAFESDPARRATMQAAIESLGSRARLVTACSRPLEAGARSWAPNLMYLPNAVEPPSDPLPEPSDLAGVNRPRLGYAGTLHASRIDIAIIIEAARSRPGWSFVMLGPDLLDAESREPLADLDNVVFLGVRPHQEVRAYLEHFDVCLLPNLVTEFTRSLDPLKLYEYLAAGRPVISTPVDNAPELADLISVATDASDLVDKAEALMAGDSPDLVARRRERVEGATWEAAHTRSRQRLV